MRIVCPFTDLHPRTERVLRRAGAEFVDVGDDEYAYWRLLMRLWAEGQPFTIVEHDMEPSAAQLRQLAACPEPLCVHEYRYRGDQSVWALGCAKFGAELLGRQLQWTFQLRLHDYAGHPRWFDASSYLFQQLPQPHLHQGLVRHHGARP